MRRLAIPTTITLAVLLGVGIANAELTQQGNLRLKFSGRLAPKKLPRSSPAPVTVRVNGAIGTADGHRPPQLRKIAIAFNRYGRVSTAGLPVCLPEQLEQTTSEIARRKCGGALVGRGNFRANVDLAGRESLPVDGEALAFNSSRGGRPGLLLHIYGSQPVQFSIVLNFRIIRLKKGTFGTIFVANIPKIASDVGYVTNIDLAFGRRYTYRGQRRSFLSARCPVPIGVPGAVFVLAKGTFSFTNGQRIATSLARNCWVR